MTTATPPSDQDYPGHQGDRLGFALVLAAAVHALVIFGFGFQSRPAAESSPALEVTLARHPSSETPEDARHIASVNQRGSGSQEQSREVTTDRLAELESAELRDTQAPVPPPQQRREEHKAPPVVTADTDAGDQARQQDRESQPGNAELNSPAPEVVREIASLRARLDEQKQAYSQMPRVLRLTTVSAAASDEAQYLHQWIRRVEEIGNLNYPEEARRQGIFGHLSLAVSLGRDGGVKNIEVLRSSGHRVLDQAAMRIVRLASPFAPIPADISEDRIEIIRTWRFIPGNQLATDAR